MEHSFITYYLSSFFFPLLVNISSFWGSFPNHFADHLWSFADWRWSTGTPLRTTALGHIATTTPTNEKSVESYPLSWARPRWLFSYIKCPANISVCKITLEKSENFNKIQNPAKWLTSSWFAYCFRMFFFRITLQEKM